MTYLMAYVATLIAFFALDMLWLGVLARKFYANQLGRLMADNPNWLVAIAFYAMYIAGIVFFAIRPAIEAEQVLKAALYGALFGFFCYATYDLTNLATLRDWPVKLVIVDILWGTLLTGSCAAAGAWATLKFAA